MGKKRSTKKAPSGTQLSETRRKRSFRASARAARSKRSSAYATVIDPQETLVRFAISLPWKRDPALNLKSRFG